MQLKANQATNNVSMLQPFSVETCLRAENVYYSGMKFYLAVIALCAHDDQDDYDDKN